LWLAVETSIFRRESDENEEFLEQFERDFDRIEAPPAPRRPTLFSRAFAALRQARLDAEIERQARLEDEEIARLFASDDDDDEIDRELVAIDNQAHVDLPELEDLDVGREPIARVPVPAGEGGLGAYFRRVRAERPFTAVENATLRHVDSLTRLHRATAEYRFSSPQDEEEHERERIRLARESLAENERRLDEQERRREEAWRLQETLLLDSIATSIRESATAAPLPPSRRQ